MVIEDERGKNLFTQQRQQQQLVMINGKWNSISRNAIFYKGTAREREKIIKKFP